MELNQLKELKSLQEENRRLKQMYADLALENKILRDVIEKSSNARGKKKEIASWGIGLNVEQGAYFGSGKDIKIGNFVGLGKNFKSLNRILTIEDELMMGEDVLTFGLALVL